LVPEGFFVPGLRILIEVKSMFKYGQWANGL